MERAMTAQTNNDQVRIHRTLSYLPGQVLGHVAEVEEHWIKDERTLFYVIKVPSRYPSHCYTASVTPIPAYYVC